MTCTENLAKVAGLLLDGIMFHSAAADLYDFLGLDGFYEHQKHERDEDLKNLDCLKHHTQKYHHMLIDAEGHGKADLIPREWFAHSSEEVTPTDITNILKLSIDLYIDHENKTLESLKEHCGYANQIQDKRFIEDLMCDVAKEKAEVEELKHKMTATGFNSVHIQLIQKKYKNK